MRVLSLRQVSDCEHAREERCRCRCKGMMHGSKRGDGEAFFTALPPDDPHYVESDQVKKARQRRERLERKRRRYHELIGMYARDK